MIYCASGPEDENDFWALLPPTLPTGEELPAAQLIDTDSYRETELMFPVARPGRRSDLTFFYWQTYAATERGKAVLQDLCSPSVWFSPARSTEGDQLWIVRPPLIPDAIDYERSKLDFYPEFPPGHPLAHLSGGTRNVRELCLKPTVIGEHNLFFLTEYPICLIIAESLINDLRNAGITGVGTRSYPAIVG